MTVGPECLSADEAVDLGELLEFVGGWLAAEGQGVAESFRRFVGNDGYDIAELRADLARFVFLLGGDDDGGSLFGGGAR